MSEGFSDVISAALATVVHVGECALHRWEDVTTETTKSWRSCLVVTVLGDLFKVHNWIDFEVRIKQGLQSVFDAVVRILIVDGDELVLSKSQAVRTKKIDVNGGKSPHKHGLRYSMDRGVVGKCARTKKVIRLTHLCNSSVVDASADGLDVFSADSTCLVGVLESVENVKLGVFAVVQVVRVEKRKFSKDDESLFTSMMAMAGEAGSRVIVR